MSATDAALLIGSLAAFATAIGGVLLNGHRIDELEHQLDQERQQRKDERRAAQQQADIARTNIILIGESMAGLRSDNAAMALLINQLFNQFQEATGHKPEVNIEMLKHMNTLRYVTGPLGPLEVPER